MTIRAYCRVSTALQTTQNQRKNIEDSDFKVDFWYQEEGVSGSIKALYRPIFARMMEECRSGDCCIVTHIDRLGRDAEDILNTINEFTRLGVKLRITSLDGIDVTSPAGKMVVTIMGALAEMEKNILIERTINGMIRAKEEGVIMGPPLKIAPDTMDVILADKKNGMSVSKISKKHNIIPNTISRNITKWEGNNAGYRKEYNARKLQYESSGQRSEKNPFQ